MKSTAVIVFVVMLIVGAVTSISLVSWGLSHYNATVAAENKITESYQKAKTTLSTHSSSILELVQVPKMAQKQLLELVEANMQGRYGKDGSGAVFQMLREQNLSIDQEMHKQIMRRMETGRDDFKNDMNVVTTHKNAMYTRLDTVPSGVLLQFLGFPRIKIGYKGSQDDYKIIQSDYSQKAFETGIDNGVRIDDIVTPTK